MSAALKSYVPRPTPTQRPRASQRNPNPGFSRDSQRSAEPAQLRPLPSAEPSRLRVVLGQLHLVSSVLATALVGLSLASYGASVYVDRQLNQATQRLSQLQRSEQQLTTANAILTSHMAQQAGETATGLQPPKPDQVIFLKPAPTRTQPATVAVVPPLSWLGRTPPLGY
jgi:hypothetical protein